MASGASRRAMQKVTREVKPLLSQDPVEARLRVLSLYKAWHRHIPFMMMTYNLPVSQETIYKQLRKKFEENRHVKDIRVIDMLVIKGQQDLKEIVEVWSQPTHIMSKHFKESHVERPKDFMSKFLSGVD